MTQMDLWCPACCKTYALEEGFLACPRSRPGEDHGLQKIMHPAAAARTRIERGWKGGIRDSFTLFADLMGSCRLLDASAYADLLGAVSDRLDALEGKRFRVQPLVEATPLKDALGRTGRLWIKDETGNVTGSHKGRHLMATLLYLEALRAPYPDAAKRVLAVYSCGNAALGAAAVARAGGYELHAFVPEDVDPAVAADLRKRDAVVEQIARIATGGGDPCYLAFRRAVTRNRWIPFSCSGSDNWSNIEGGETLGWELILQLTETLSSCVIQVGGGALGRAVVEAWETFYRMGLVGYLPKIYACQPEGGFPFVRTYYLVLKELADRNGLPFELDYDKSGTPKIELRKLVEFSVEKQGQIQDAVDRVKENFDSEAVQTFLRGLAERRSAFMWPWDGESPKSLAHGILDDETYDWLSLLSGMLRSGGKAEILTEKNIEKAFRLAHRYTEIPVCPTGSAGLAGLLQLEAGGCIDPGESVGLLFTGMDRTKQGAETE